MLYKKPDVYFFNDDAKKFFERNGILLEDLSSILGKERRIVESFELDSITQNVSIYQESTRKSVCVADILGYDYPQSKDIFRSLSDFFDSCGDGYHSRSVGMLKYSSDEILSKLESSFLIEPMRLKEIKDNQYFIDANGMHRFTVLKIHYILEKYRGKDEGELRKKFTIPVVTKRLDIVKTYCAYLMKLMNDTISVRNELDTNYRNTGKALVSEEGSENRVFSDEELIIYTMELIMKYGVDVANLIRLSNAIENNPSFGDFLKVHFSELMDEILKFKDYQTTCTNQWDIYDYKCNFAQKEGAPSWNL